MKLDDGSGGVDLHPVISNPWSTLTLIRHAPKLENDLENDLETDL